MGEMATAVGNAVSSGWSRVAAFAKTVADSTSKAIQDSGFVDAVYSVINGQQTPQTKQSREGLLSNETQSRGTTNSGSFGTTQTSYSSSGSSVSSGMKPAHDVDDDLDEILGKPIKGKQTDSSSQKKKTVVKKQEQVSEDPDEWLDMALEQEAAKQKQTEPVVSATSSDKTDDWDNW